MDIARAKSIITEECCRRVRFSGGPEVFRRLLGGQTVVGYFLDPRVNDSFRAVNRLQKEGWTVLRLHQPFTDRGRTHPPGTFFVNAEAGVKQRLEKIAPELGTSFLASAAAPDKAAVLLKPIRIGLWDRDGGSMPSG